MRLLPTRRRRHPRDYDGDGPLVFAGSASPRLTAAICEHLGVPLASSEVLRFSEGTLFVRVLENVRGRHVFLVQSTVFPTNDNVVELLFWMDALARASAASVTAVVPYFSYGKGDKKDEPRVSIRARVVADALEASGADRVVTMDLHAAQIQGFFRVPVDDLQALPYLCDAVVALELPDPVVVAPDAGFVKRARRFARRLGAPLAIADKMRTGHGEAAEVLAILGDVEGKDAIIVDDFTVSGGTLVEAAAELAARGARTVTGAVTHGVFAAGSGARIDSSRIERLVVTDTVETQPEAPPATATVVSVAPLFAEAIRRIHHRESISVLFPP
jgi:ribose-phosphate pyrophosphokinase